MSIPHRPSPPTRPHARLHELTVIDVRTPGEYASGHLPGAHNIPLDHIRRGTAGDAAAAEAAATSSSCAPPAPARRTPAGMLAEQGIAAATLVGGTGGWAASGARPAHTGRP